MSRNRILSLLVVSGLVGISTVSANFMVTGFTWNAGSGMWSNPANWTPGGGPPDDAGDTATLGSAATVTLDASYTVGSVSLTHTAATLNTNNNALTFGTLTNGGLVQANTGLSNGLYGSVVNQSGANINVLASAMLSIGNSTLSNSGTITINSNQGGANTILHFPAACAITGSGRLQMSQTGPWAQLTSATGVALTNGVAHTIGGRGIISALLVNNGNVTADWASQELYLSDQPKANNATFQAQATGTLVINGVTINQSAAGQIVANGGNVSIRNGSVINGGLFASTAGFHNTVDTGTVTVSNFTNNGSFRLSSGTTLTAGAGVFVNAGTLNINHNQGGSGTILNFTAPVTITGAGTIQMSQDGGWAQLNSDTGVLVSNSASQTIKGRGHIGANLANAGTILADWGSATLALSGQPKSNTGLISATTGILSISGCTLTQSGAGQIFANGGNVGIRNDAVVTGGTFNSTGGGAIYFDAGNATIGNFTNNGNLNVAAGRVVTVGSGLFANNGLINLNYQSGGADTTLHFTDNTALSGNGVIQMSQGGTWCQVSADAGKTITQQPNHTIKGRGIISAALNNFGVVSADWSNNTLVLTGAPKSNANLFKTAGSGVLALDACSVTQTGAGTIFAEAGNVGLRNGVTITGGTLNSNSGSGIYCDTVSANIANLTNAGSLNVQSGVQLNGSGTIVNNGTININYNQGGATTSFNASDNLTLAGTGLLQMSQGGAWADLITAPGKTVTNATTHTIQGRGQISGELINNGNVIANWGNATLELLGAVKTNNATIKSGFSSSVLSIRDCTVNQSANGTINAEAGNVGLRGTAVINGGKLESQATFGHYVDAGAPTVSGVTNLGNLNVQSGITLKVGSSGLVNNGALNINYNQAAANTLLLAEADCTISGTGLIQLSQAGSWAQITANTGATITLDPGLTIQGRGQLNGSIINRATITANWGSSVLEINPAGGGFRNRGGLNSGPSAATLTINNATLFTNETGGTFTTLASHVSTVNGGDYKQTGGSTIVNGQLNVSGGNKVDIVGGTLGGSGIVNAPVANNGTGEASPGNSAGKLRIQGTYTQGANAKALIELGGTTQTTQYDLLEVTGTASLNGTLRLKLINGFTPTPADTFTIVTGGSVTGSFSSVTVEGGSIDLEPSVVYSANSVTVTFLTKVDPLSYAITGGGPAGGNLASLLFSDDNRLLIQCDEFDDVGVLEVTTTSPIPTPTKLRFAFESSASRADLTEILDLWNYTTNQWVTIPPSAVTTMTDRRRVFVVTSNVGQYIKAGTAEMKARIRWIPQNDNGAIDGWNIRVDQTIWFVGP